MAHAEDSVQRLRHLRGKWMNPKDLIKVYELIVIRMPYFPLELKFAFLLLSILNMAIPAQTLLLITNEILNLKLNLVPRVFALGERNTLVWPGHVTRGSCVKWHIVY